MSVTRALLTVAALAAVAWPAHAGLVPLPKVRAAVADPQRPYFYVSTDRSLVAISLPDGSVAATVPLPGTAGSLAVSADGSELYVGLLDVHDVAVLELPSLRIDRVLEMGVTIRGPLGLVAARQGRIVVGFSEIGAASLDKRALLVDSITGAILDDGSGGQAPKGDRLYVGSDRCLIVGVDDPGLPSFARVVDICDDRFCYVADAPTLQHMSPDGLIGLQQSSYAGDGVVMRGPPPGLPVVAGVLAPFSSHWRAVMGVSPTGKHVFTTSNDYDGYGDRVLVSDLPTLAPLAVLDPVRRYIHDVLVVSGDGAFLAVGTSDDPRYEADGVEIFALNNLVPSVGGALMRVVDRATSQPVRPNADTNSAHVGWINPAAGLVAWGPARPGTHEVTLRLSPTTLTVTIPITAGQWTDLGTLMVDASAPFAERRFSDIVTEPLLAPGETQDVLVQGMGFLPTSELVSLSPFVTVHRFRVLDGGRIEANISVSEAVAFPQLLSAGEIRNVPPGRPLVWAIRIIDTECPATRDMVPPAEVTGLLLEKRGGGPTAVVDWSWDETLLDWSRGPEVMGSYEVTRSLLPDLWTGATWRATDSRGFTGAVAWEDVRCTYFLVRARDAALNVGRLR